MSNGIDPITGRRPHRFVMRRPKPIPIEPFHVSPPIKCRDCGAVDIWCTTCEARHPIRSIDDHTHVAFCIREEHKAQLRQHCPLAGRADHALDQQVHERKREIAAAMVGALIGFITGVALTLLTVAIVGGAYLYQGVEHRIEQ